MTFDNWKTTNPADEELGTAGQRLIKAAHQATEIARHGRTEYDYRGYHIWHEMTQVPTRAWDWHYQHEDFDLDDNRFGHCASMEACKGEIDDQIEDEEFEAQAAKELAPYRRPLREEERDI